MEKLWYESPAQEWKHGLLIGTGRLAGTVFGNGSGERLGLNHELLYSGKYRLRECEPETPESLAEIRQALFSGDYAKATALCAARYGGGHGAVDTNKIDDYKPAGELVIVPDIIENRGYRRWLDLETATAGVSYDGVTYDYVADSVHDRLYIRIRGALSARVDLEFRPDPDLEVEPLHSGKGLRAIGTYTGGVNFETRVTVQTDGGFDGQHLTVEQEALLTVDIEVGLDELEDIAQRLTERAIAVDGSFEGWIAPHIARYQEVMNRLELTLDHEDGADLPTDRRIAVYREGGTDLTLLKQYFDFGRYLMYAGSVCAAMPLHLQGKWNDLPNPPWNCDYHDDINTQMNYWPAEQIGMGDAHMALMRYVERMVPSARLTAKRLYGCRGVVMPYSDDLWARSTFGAGGWGIWVGGAPWLAEHFYRHYEYTGNEAYLKEEAYPFLREVCAFFEDYLVEDDKGTLQVAPSQSPENRFTDAMTYQGVEYPVSICISSAMDLTLIREVMQNAIAAANHLGCDADKAARWTSILDRLQPLQIGSDGRLLEWDKEHTEVEPGHRHLSHLYGVYPAGLINETDTPELFAAARKSYDYRMAHGGGYTGWSRSWCAILDARFSRGEDAMNQVKELIREFSSDSLLDLHPPKIFQIDGNFGGICGILEMLVRVTGKRIRLLPALPSELPGGCLRGVRLPGGAVATIVWKDGRLEKAEITVGFSGSVLLEGDLQIQGGEVSAVPGGTLVTAPAGTVLTVTQ